MLLLCEAVFIQLLKFKAVYMKKIYSLMLLFTLTALSVTVFAQTPMLRRQTGVNGNSIPLGSGWNNYKGAYIYAPGELTGTLQGGTINKIYLRPTATGTTTITNLIVRLSQTTATTFTNTTYPNGTLVYQGNITLSHTANGWVAITLQNGFAYNPSQSIVVEISNTSVTGTGMVMNTTTLAGKRLYASGQTATTGNIDTQWSDFGFDMLTAPNNVGITALLSPANSCGETSTPVTVRIQNYGNNSMTGFSITTDITGAMTTTFNRPVFSRSIPAGGSDTAIMGYINTSATIGNVNFKSYSYIVSDTARWNDTNLTSINFLSTPGNAVFTQNPVNVCGSAPINISTTNVANTSTLWYNSATGGGVLAINDTLSSGLLVAPTTTFYAAKARFTASQNFGFAQSNTYYGGSGFGYMVDVTAGNSSLIIDSLSFFNTTGFTASNFKVYYKLGSLTGFQSSPTSWILAADLKNYSLPGFGENKIPAGNFIVPAGQVMGVYVFIESGTAYMHNPASSITNGDITISNTYINNGSVFSGNLGQTYQIDIKFYYRKACVSSRLPITINMNPRPTGADLLPGAIFQGTSNVGTSLSPDVVGELDTVIYKLVPPTAFNNANFGSAWTISALSFNTIYGNPPATGDTLTMVPSVSNDGTLRFVPSALYADSTFKLNITLYNMSTGCDSTLERYLYVAPKPVPNFGASLACDGQDVNFTDSSSIRSGQMYYLWNFGDTTNATSIDQNPKYTYSGPGTYTVTLDVTSGYGYKKTITKQVTVYYRPDPNFSFTNVCLGGTSQFTNKSTLQGTQFPMTYLWTMGNSSTSTQTNASTQYPTFGNYNVTLKATTSVGCERSITKEVNVFPLPDADFTSGPPCSGLNTQFNNNSTIAYGLVGYEWEFGDGTDETQKSPTHTYDATGTYSVKMIATSEFGCVDSIRKNVVVSVKPVSDFTFSNTCLGDSVKFTNTSTISGSTIASTEWNFGDGNTSGSNASSFRHTYGTTGVYTVKLKSTSINNCSDEKTITVAVTQKPSADFGTLSGACAGTELQFNNLSTIGAGTLGYSWNFGAGTSTLENPKHTFAAAGSFPVSLTATSSAGCADMISKNIVVNALPNAAFTVAYTNKAIREIKCTPADSNLMGYLWDMGDGTTFTQIAPVYSYLSNGPFTVKLSAVSNAGCIGKGVDQTVFFNVSDGNTLASKSGFEVYPNPFTDRAAVKVMLAENTSVNIDLIDQLGRKISTIASGNFNAGEHEFELNATSSMASGIYFIVLTTNSSREVKSIVLKK
jgi:PKD repeat protein